MKVVHRSPYPHRNEGTGRYGGRSGVGNTLAIALLLWLFVLVIHRQPEEIGQQLGSSWRREQLTLSATARAAAGRADALPWQRHGTASQQQQQRQKQTPPDYVVPGQLSDPVGSSWHAADEAAPALRGLQAMSPLAAGTACLPPLDPAWPSLLHQAELSVYSQNAEDGVLLGILLNIGVAARYYVEFGTEDGSQCNTRLLRDKLGWHGLLMDGGHERPDINLHKEFVTPDNINALLAKYVLGEAGDGSPGSGGSVSANPDDPRAMIDVLSIDLDFSDWYVWRAINSSRFHPRVVVAEYNAGVPPNTSATVDIADRQRWTGSAYFGASLRALAELGKAKGYSLVYCDSQGVNAFFVRSDILACQNVTAPQLEEVYRPPHYAGGSGHPPETNTSRQWVLLDEAGREVGRRSAVEAWR